MRPSRPWRRLALALGLVLPLAIGCGREPVEDEPAEGPETVAEAEAEGDEAILVFPDRSGGLVPVRAPLAPQEDRERRLRALVEALLAGPGDREDLVAPFGDEVALGDLVLGPRGVAYVDLVSESLADPPESGSQVELQRVFSLVNTLLANDSETRAVVLLWNGRQRPTFAGHVNTGYPLGIERGLLRDALE